MPMAQLLIVSFRGYTLTVGEIISKNSLSLYLDSLNILLRQNTTELGFEKSKQCTVSTR